MFKRWGISVQLILIQPADECPRSLEILSLEFHVVLVRD